MSQNYLENLKEYTNSYVWNKFKHSPATLFGLVSLIAVPVGIAISDLPSLLQVFSVIPLGILGTSFWWYRFEKAEEYAKQGALKYQDWHRQEINKKLFDEFQTVNINNLKKHDSLKNDLWEAYQSFNDALKDQGIISEQIYNRFELKAEKGFHSAVNLLKEISDLLKVQNGTNINKLENQLSKSEGKNAKIIQNNIDIYNQNNQKIEELVEVIQRLTLSFQSSKLNLASATSSFESQNDVEQHSDELTMAVEASKKVQERLNSFGNNDTNSIINKYRSKNNA